MINTAATPDASYMNFLRCVTAIMTAASGTTTLTVNPFTNNTGTIDNTKNCIVSIDANTEAGGWTTSASHSIVNSGAFTSPTTTSQLYKADFYNASGKSAMPYNKVTFTNWVGSASNMFASQLSTTLAAGWASLSGVIFVNGPSTTSDLTSANYAVGSHAITSTAQTSTTLNPWIANNSSYAGSMTGVGLLTNNTNCYYRMAVTSNYCILWEVPNNNSYASGYSGTIGTGAIGTYVHPEWSYGSLYYAGMRETQAWENALNHNPPWCAMQIVHTTKASAQTSDQISAYMATMNDTGISSSTSQLYYSINNYSTYSNIVTGLNTTLLETTQAGTQTITAATNAAINNGIKIPLFLNRDNSSTTYTNQFHMPVSDPNTGALVPPAIPIVVRRFATGSWNNGGALRGIYKSLSMPLSTMKLYFSNGQTFTIGSDTYIPIVFNESMYLIRNA